MSANTNATQMRAPRRAKQTLNTMLENRTITQEGLNWLTMATDPFHDTELAPTGFPDADSSRSIPQCFVSTTQVVAPPTLSTPTWDAHIFFNPISWQWAAPTEYSTPVPQARYKVNRNGLATASFNGVFLQAGYNALSLPANFDWINSATAPPGGAASPYGLAYPKQGSSGQFRLVGCGFEVVNTTPDLYRGGSITVYRTPSSTSTRQIQLTPATPYFVQSTVTLPPSSQTEAQLYPSSRTWGAEDGCYVVGTLSGTVCPYLVAQPNAVSSIQMMTPDVIQDGTNANTTNCFMFQGLYTEQMARCSQILPYDNHGCVLTGLQPQATLQVTVRYYVERIPTSSNPELVVLTRAPTPYDPVALEIYSRAMAHLPVGVPVDQNPLGEWFNDIMDTISEWGPKVGNALGTIIPGAGAVGTAIGTAASGLRAINGTAKPKKRPRKPRKKPAVNASPPPSQTQRVSNQKRKKKN